MGRVHPDLARGPNGGRHDQVIYYQYGHDRARLVADFIAAAFADQNRQPQPASGLCCLQRLRRDNWSAVL